MANEIIRTAAKARGVFLWEIADELGIAEATLSKKLRHELDEPERAKALEAIDNIAKARIAE